MSRQLPVVAARRRELETCGYCPKLCRSTCPVSEAARSEALIPWGKMSSVWQTGLGRIEADHEHAGLAWACTGCEACRTRCDHDNPVWDTLRDARADYFSRGLAPPSVLRAVERAKRRASARAQWVEARNARRGVRPTADRALLIGCGYHAHLSDVADDILAVAERALGPVRVLAGCCGAPFLHAGDRNHHRQSQADLAAEVRGAQLFVYDPGCARTLSLPFELLVRHVASWVLRLDRSVPSDEKPRVRWHDPCQLGRGLAEYRAPRVILEHALGAPPLEFAASRERGHCSGGGGLVPAWNPELARAMVETRLQEHTASGGGKLVTACAASLRQFSSAGAAAVDLLSLARQELGVLAEGDHG